jgi:hypothetical protein
MTLNQLLQKLFDHELEITSLLYEFKNAPRVSRTDVDDRPIPDELFKLFVKHFGEASQLYTQDPVNLSWRKKTEVELLRDQVDQLRAVSQASRPRLQLAP